jgi:hypothetical protein
MCSPASGWLRCSRRFSKLGQRTASWSTSGGSARGLCDGLEVFAGGLLAGDGAVDSPVFLVYVVRFVAGWALPVALLLGLNIHLFGSPLASGYDRILVIDRGDNIDTYSQRSIFSLDPVKGMRGHLFDRSHDLLTTSPATLLSFVGLSRLFGL